MQLVEWTSVAIIFPRGKPINWLSRLAHYLQCCMIDRLPCDLFKTGDIQGVISVNYWLVKTARTKGFEEVSLLQCFIVALVLLCLFRWTRLTTSVSFLLQHSESYFWCSSFFNGSLHLLPQWLILFWKCSKMIYILGARSTFAVLLLLSSYFLNYEILVVNIAIRHHALRSKVCEQIVVCFESELISSKRERNCKLELH